MTYLDYLKDEISYRFFGSLLAAIFFGASLYFNKAVGTGFLNIFLLSSALFVGILSMNAYVKYNDKKISFSRSLSMTYLDYLKHELRYNSFHFFLESIVIGLILFFISGVSFWMVFLVSGFLVFVGPMISAYAKMGHRKI